MYYSKGNYEAFARPRKPAGSDAKSAWIVGSGLAGLAAAVFLIRDAQVPPGEQIHVFEELPPRRWIARRHRQSRHRLHHPRRARDGEPFRVPLGHVPLHPPLPRDRGASYLDEYYWLDKDDPNSSNCRLIHDRGNRVPSDGRFTLSDRAQEEIVSLWLTSESELGDRTIEDHFTEDFFESNFWLYWSTMFAFERWHSLAEMRRYLLRFVHHIDGLPDFTALKFNKYNQYESMVKPLLAYLQDHDVDFRYGTTVRDIRVEEVDGTRTATRLLVTVDGEDQDIDLSEDDLVFVTNGSITESTTYGDHHTPAPPTDEPGGSWTLWRNLAAQSEAFGHPDVFCEGIPERSWFVSATATIENTGVDPLHRATHPQVPP